MAAATNSCTLPPQIQSFIEERSNATGAEGKQFGIKVLVGTYQAFDEAKSWSLLQNDNRTLMFAHSSHPTVAKVIALVDTGMYFGWAMSNARDMAKLLGKI